MHEPFFLAFQFSFFEVYFKLKTTEETLLIGDIPIAFASEFNSLLSKVALWKEVSRSSVIPYSFMSYHLNY